MMLLRDVRQRLVTAGPLIAMPLTAAGVLAAVVFTPLRAGDPAPSGLSASAPAPSGAAALPYGDPAELPAPPALEPTPEPARAPAGPPAPPTFAHALTIENADAGRGEYLAAVAARDAGQHAVAAAQFALAASRGGLVAPVARLRSAQMLASAGGREEAARAFAVVVDDPALPDTLRATALTDAAENLRLLRRPADAVALLGRLDTPASGAGTRAAARWSMAKVRREADDPGWAEDARAAINLSQAFPGAAEALDALFAARLGVARIPAALVNYRAGRDVDALRMFTDALNDPAVRLSAADAALAWFYIGAIEERAGRYPQALAAYQRALEQAPAGPLADDAIYWRASILGWQGDTVAHVLELDRLVRTFPDSPFGPEARLRAAVETGRAGRVAEALTRLESITRTRPTEEAAAAARWHTVFQATAGAPAVAPIAAAAFDPTSFPAILDRSATDAQVPLPPGAFGETPGGAPDESPVPAWMERIFGPDAPRVSAEDERLLALGFELVAAGEDSVGRRVLSLAIARRTDRPHDLLEVARTAAVAGLPDIQMQAAATLLGRLTTRQRLDAPKAVLRLAYPVPYLRETVEAAQRSGVPPLLMYALVRQESAFHPRAGSSAGAQGLAQIMPGTAADIAKSLKEPAPSRATLADPATSLRYGAYFLGTQLRTFNGNVPAALSAYNGGPGNAARWQREHAPRNFDGLLWSTDFRETRTYLDHVLSNYAWYRYVYADAPLSIR